MKQLQDVARDHATIALFRDPSLALPGTRYNARRILALLQEEKKWRSTSCELVKLNYAREPRVQRLVLATSSQIPRTILTYILHVHHTYPVAIKLHHKLALDTRYVGIIQFSLVRMPANLDYFVQR